jgi:hypothetical protein
MFLVALGVTTYSLVAEKLIAIEFAKKELIGSQYLATIRKAYDVILMHREENGSARDIDDVLSALQAAEANASGSLQTSELQQEFAVALRNLAASPPTPGNPALLDALAKARVLAVRILTPIICKTTLSKSYRTFWADWASCRFGGAELASQDSFSISSG